MLNWVNILFMPNHVHLILVMRKTPSVGTSHVMSLPSNGDIFVGARHVVPTHENQFSKPVCGSIPVIIQQFKSSVKDGAIKTIIHIFNGNHGFTII